MANKSQPSSAGTKQMKVMLAGGLAGAFSKTCTAPLGRMTILFQLGAFKGQESVWGAIKQVVHSQGFFSLWRGHSATLLHRVPYSSVNFAVFEHTKSVLAPMLKSRHEGGSYATESARYLIAGAAGGSTGCIVAYPLDLVKTKMAGNLAKEVPRRGALVSCVWAIMQQAGVQGLYKGIGATLMQVTPTLAINFTAYELTKAYIAALMLPTRCPSQAPPAAPPPPPPLPRPQAAAAAADAGAGSGSACRAAAEPQHGRSAGCARDSSQHGASEARALDAAALVAQAARIVPAAPPLAASRQEDTRGRGAQPAPGDAISRRAFVSLAAGTVSGVVSSTMTFPLDVVRRRVQFAPDTTYAQVVRAIYADGGPRAFYRGLMPEYMKVIPGVSIAFCAYEVLKAVLDV